MLICKSVQKSKFPDARAGSDWTGSESSFSCLKEILIQWERRMELYQSAVWTHNDQIEFAPEGADGDLFILKEKIFKVNQFLDLADLLKATETSVDLLKLTLKDGEMTYFPILEPQLPKVKTCFWVSFWHPTNSNWSFSWEY